ncbi:DUF3939 domain-containing protein [Anaerobacillus sp. MEB173]|uniref:DUF3939 domain-containing protein n=1 Tax=Anaerobacillus sp. MEB173 TaxID=3383345 RepID=UPI003F905562
MFDWFNKKKKEEVQYQEIDATIHDIRSTITQWEENAPKGVYRSVLVKEDNSIDTTLLLPYLKGIPKKKFFMSKATYETFEEEEKEIPKYLDIVQQAVDKYIYIENKLPVIDFDPNNRLNYFLLMNKGYLKEKPPLDLYLTNEENMITHRRKEC